jgi:hypothetical protein
MTVNSKEVFLSQLRPRFQSLAEDYMITILTKVRAFSDF